MPARYHGVAILLHWLMAAAILFMLGLGLFMTQADKADPDTFGYYQLHKSIGITILLLSILRLIWRLTHKVPPLPDHMPRWEKFAANASHWLLYFFMFALPLTGWALVSSSPWNIPTLLFHILPWPHLPVLPELQHKAEVSEFFTGMHEWLAYGMIALLAAHIGAALRHHFLLKDNVLEHMLPKRLIPLFNRLRGVRP